MLNNIQTYLKFLLKSSNQHDVHSPFVYNFITKCLYNNNYIEKINLNQINTFIAVLTNNHNIITITDFGAGSKVFKDNKRKISAIAKNAGITKKRSELLYRITQYFEAKQILEIGTSLGIATASMALTNQNGVITTLEGCPETAPPERHRRPDT